ncbi:hypothetical protein [Halobellus inordinatus]|uniref:hypothetical protein n=1 Tax=Halobellus inordinatus TaxID=1126236 RepID=UPI00210A6E08|nr:hypothetical protein [Halobellus inordinatus]
MTDFPTPEVEVVAAKRLDDDTDETCDYECENDADYRILTHVGVEFVCCQRCSDYNRVYAKENDILDADYAAAKARYKDVETDGGQPLPDGVEAICEEFDLERPTPGERWEFHLDDVPSDRDVGGELVAAGCDLCREYVDGDGRTYEYKVPEPGWPEPLGYVTTDEPAWVDVQTEWKRDGEKFVGSVRGTIPDAGDCDRHPDLSADAYALKSIYIYGPTETPKFHAKTSLEVPDDAWTVNLTYEQATGSYRTMVAVYSGELGRFPERTEWKAAPHGNDERRRVEFFETRERAIAFVEAETGLSIPRHDEQIRADGGQEQKECPYRGCDWTGREYNPGSTHETIAAEVDATIHWESEHGGEIPEDAEFGDQQCPECYAVHGMNGTVSCSECGHIPEEVRADGGTDADVVVATSREDGVELVLAFRHDGSLRELATADGGRIELYRDEAAESGGGGR